MFLHSFDVCCCRPRRPTRRHRYNTNAQWCNQNFSISFEFADEMAKRMEKFDGLFLSSSDCAELWCCCHGLSLESTWWIVELTKSNCTKCKTVELLDVCQTNRVVKLEPLTWMNINSSWWSFCYFWISPIDWNIGSIVWAFYFMETFLNMLGIRRDIWGKSKYWIEEESHQSRPPLLFFLAFHILTEECDQIESLDNSTDTYFNELRALITTN